MAFSSTGFSLWILRACDRTMSDGETLYSSPSEACATESRAGCYNCERSRANRKVSVTEIENPETQQEEM